MKEEMHILVKILIIFGITRVYSSTNRSRYFLLYDVNPGEGFNLRRDVYIRMANLVRVLREPTEFPFQLPDDMSYSTEDWRLVLPPWGALPHWRLKIIHPNKSYGLPWSTFFDVESLNLLIPVMEFEEFLHEISISPDFPVIDEAFYITHDFAQKQFIDLPNPTIFAPSRLVKVPGTDLLYCAEYSTGISKFVDGTYNGFYSDSLQKSHCPQASNLSCLSGVLQAVQLAPFLADLVRKKNTIRTVYLGSAESVINGHWSEWSAQYWTARRSLVFSKKLTNIANMYRLQFLNSCDSEDRTLPPNSWLYAPWPSSPALGGPFMAVHWRRGDFLEYSPAPRVAAEQILFALRQAFHDDVSLSWPLFVSSDATDQEFSEFSSLFPSRPVLRFIPNRLDLSPGEVSIVDQLICSHARYFIGTNPSTFTFRITEERQIMGFSSASTYNTLCRTGNPSLYLPKTALPAKNEDCESLTPWTVFYESRFTLPLSTKYASFNSSEIRISDEL